MIQPAPPDLRALRSHGEALLYQAENLTEAGAPMDNLLSRRIARYAADVDRPVAGPPTPQAAVDLLFELLEVMHGRLFPPPAKPPRRYRRRPILPVRDRLLEHLHRAGPTGMSVVRLIKTIVSTARDAAPRELAAMEAEGLVRIWTPERRPGIGGRVGRRVALVAEPPRTAGGEGR